MLYKSTNLGVRQTAAYRVGLLNIRVDAKQTLSQSLAGEDSISISEYYLFTVYFSGMHSILRSTSVSILVSSRLYSVRSTVDSNISPSPTHAHVYACG